ncbi:MAG: hypothetical protein R3C11_21200 [Planctomycetaceae bacterium]
MTRTVTLCGVLITSVTLMGCTHFVETKAIEQFVTALKEEDLEQLRENTSEDFNEKACAG